MKEQGYISGSCPQCGKTIQVPGELTRFSCLYCGRRMTPEELVRKPSGETGDPEALERLCREFPEAVTSLPDALNYLTAKAYTPRFEAYLEQHRPLFETIPPACGGNPETIEKLAERVIAALKEKSETGRRGLTSRDGRLEELKYTLCLFTVPGLRATELPDCQALAQALRQVWCREFPKKPFQLTTAGEIQSGFQPRKLCFITTAVCHQMDKADDCPELMAFRDFRDSWLARTPEGQELIDRYYALAPRIVLSVNLCHDATAVWASVWREHLVPCYRALGRNEPNRCLALYKAMVLALEKQYLSHNAL